MSQTEAQELVKDLYKLYYKQKELNADLWAKIYELELYVKPTGGTLWIEVLGGQ